MTYLKTKYLVITTDYVFPTLLFLSSLGVIYLLFFSSVFRVSSIACIQDFEPCTNPFILAETEHLKGQNLFLLNSEAFVTKLKTGNFQTRDAQIKKILPNSLTISLQSVYPILAIQIVGDRRLATLDPELRVIKFSENNANVPIIEYNSSLTFQIGKKIDDEKLNHSILFIAEVTHALANISRISLTEDLITLIFTDNLQAILTTRRDSISQIDALKAVLGDATIREGLRKVDVRFAQPVLIKD